LNAEDIALLAVHSMFSLKSLFDRSLASLGPWSSDKKPSDDLFAVISLITHFRSFFHLLTKEARGSFAKKLALILGFALGNSLTVF